MINLSKQDKERESSSIIDRLIHFREPDLYLAENIMDYKNNASHISPPIYKRRICGYRYVYIQLYHLRIEHAVEEEETYPDIFRIDDQSGSAIVFWGDKGSIFPPIDTFEDLEEEGFREGDAVYSVLLKYIIDKDLPLIISVDRNRRPDRSTGEETLSSRILTIDDLILAPIS